MLERVADEGRSADADEPNLVISVFGALTASYRGRPIDIKLRKGAAILGYLCLQENLTARRDRLAFLLWSESDNNSARTSLRQTLITLRRAFRAVGCNALKTTKITVSLDPRDVDINLKRLLAATDDGRVDEALLAVERLPETLLEGMEDLDEEFRMWLLPTRQALNNRLERSLSKWLADASTSEQSRLQAATALLRVDPTNEAALRHKLLSFAGRGDFIGALRMYRRFETMLTTEYGLKPSAELQLLINRVQAESASRDRATASPQSAQRSEFFRRDDAAANPEAPHDTITIHLAAFAIHGIDERQNHVVSGFRHALADSLVRFREWIIVDAGRAPLGESRPPLTYDYELQGTLYEVDGAIEVVLTLLRVQDSNYPWSQIIRLDLDRWPSTQHDIIREIASTLKVHISAERLSRGVNHTRISVTAFDQWLRAQASAFSLDPSRLNEARESLRDVAQTHPTYSPLFSALAQLDNVESTLRPGIFRIASVTQSAIHNARVAVQLDALDSRAHLALGWAYAFAWDFEAAMPHMRLAVALNESDPWPHISTALFWTLADKIDLSAEGVRAFTARSRCLTVAAAIYLAQIHFLNRDFELALTLMNSLGSVAPTIAGWRAAAMAHLGHLSEARETAQAFLSRSRDDWTGSSEPTDENIVNWLLQAHPFRHFPHWSTMREGLKLSQLPVRHVKHASFSNSRQRHSVDV